MGCYTPAARPFVSGVEYTTLNALDMSQTRERTKLFDFVDALVRLHGLWGTAAACHESVTRNRLANDDHAQYFAPRSPS